MPRVELGACTAALALLLAASPAEAACTVSTAGVAFGVYNPQGAAPDDSAGTIQVDCHPSDQSVEVAIGAGQSGTFTTRRMNSGTATLDYNLYADAGRTLVWGDGLSGAGSQTLTSGSVSGGTRRFTATIYGRIPAGQNVPAGTYGDTLIVTITF